MRVWRNWQTRKTKDLVGNTMQVQFLSTAPRRRKARNKTAWQNAKLFSFTPASPFPKNLCRGKSFWEP